MAIRLTWNRSKAASDLKKHRITFEQASRVFDDPYVVSLEDCETEEGMRYHAIGYVNGQLLALVVYLDQAQGEDTTASSRPEKLKRSKRDYMPNNITKKVSAKRKQTKRSTGNDLVTSYTKFPYVADPLPVEMRKGFKITGEMRTLYRQRNKSLDQSDAPVLPPEKWATAMRHEEMYRPTKKQTTVRIDSDVLAWLKSKGEGHLSRINSILRAAMTAERKR